MAVNLENTVTKLMVLQVYLSRLAALSSVLGCLYLLEAVKRFGLLSPLAAADSALKPKCCCALRKTLKCGFWMKTVPEEEQVCLYLLEGIINI